MRLDAYRTMSRLVSVPFCRSILSCRGQRSESSFASRWRTSTARRTRRSRLWTSRRGRTCQSSFFWRKNVANFAWIAQGVVDIYLTVSGLKGVHVPFERAVWSSTALIEPLRSRSTLERKTLIFSTLGSRCFEKKQHSLLKDLKKEVSIWHLVHSETICFRPPI